MSHPYVNARAVARQGMAAKIAGMAVPQMHRRAEAVMEKVVHPGILRTTFAAPDHSSKTTVQQNCPRPCISNMLKLCCNTSMIPRLIGFLSALIIHAARRLGQIGHKHIVPCTWHGRNVNTWVPGRA